MSSSDSPSIAELEQHIIILRERLVQIAAEVKALLAEDVPKFLERELKRAFVSHPDFASTLSDSALRTLKADIKSGGESATRDMLAAVEDNALWFAGAAAADDAKKSIAENEALWSAISDVVCGALDAIRAKYAFPAGPPSSYKPPTWFIGRRYLPSLSEKYWQLLRELHETETQIGQTRSESAKVDLTRRWDEV